MRETLSIPFSNVNQLGDQLCRWISFQQYGMVLRSNQYNFGNPLQENLKQFELIAAVGAANVVCPEKNHFDELDFFLKESDWLLGFFGYDLKNQIENLHSSNPDGLNFPEMLFFKPELVFTVNDNVLSIHYLKTKHSRNSVTRIFEEIMASPKIELKQNNSIEFEGKYSKEEYIEAVSGVLKHIQRGDIYEMNLCQEFYSKNCELNPYETFIKLNSVSPTPFSAFGKFDDKFLICASPERFLQKNGNTVVSQPIKGTCPRGQTSDDDNLLRKALKCDVKERAENVMIVDLVRNDLSRIAQRASVCVEELCGVYPFQQVNQMISTVACCVKKEKSIADVIKATFPMGSMTGAPKIRAMELIEQYERSKRGLYSGAAGYISPEKNFDFNVVIRSLLYNQTKKYLSFMVGGAITAMSNPESEYQECLLKAKAIHQTLKTLQENETKV